MQGSWRQPAPSCERLTPTTSPRSSGPKTGSDDGHPWRLLPRLRPLHRQRSLRHVCRCARHRSAVHQTHPLLPNLCSASDLAHGPSGICCTGPAGANLPSADGRYQVARRHDGMGRLPSGDRYKKAVWCPGRRWPAAFRPKSRRRPDTRRSLNLPRSGGTQSGPLPSATSDVRNAAIGTI